LDRDATARTDDTVVVVGSGPAGAIATRLLTQAGVHVTLIEAGEPSLAGGLTVRVGGLTVARMHRQLGTRTADVTNTGDPRSVVFEDIAPGGLTNHWSCAVPRFSRDDFLDARRAGDEHVWPVDYDDLAPWYDWVEPWLRISGTVADVPPLPAGKVSDVRSLDRSWDRVAAAASGDGQAVIPVPYVYGVKTTVTRSGTVFNSFVRLIKPIERSPHLAIRFGARATRLEWSPASRRVETVVVRDLRTGEDHRIRCRAVIVAAGALNSAKLLLQSTHADFPEGLGNTHGVLGRYVHDHPLGKLELAVGSPLSFSPAAMLTRQSLETTQPLYAAACLQWSGVNFLVRSALEGHPGRLSTCGFNVFGTMAPQPQNYVALDPSRSSVDGTPGMVLNVHHPPESETALVSARDQLIRLFDAAGLQPRLTGWVVDCVGSAVHYAGSCRMHASPRFGMLDRWSRLHAVRNVVVADSAAFTTGPEKNPALTAMALSARASRRLIDDLRTGDA
jgi:choline dehydrogenase-like flavoprotein